MVKAIMIETFNLLANCVFRATLCNKGYGVL